MAKLSSVDDLANSRRFKDLSLDLAQIAIDIAGIVDPTPISDGANTIISVARGDWLGAGLSIVSMVPYVGDLAKAGKFPKYLKTVEKAVVIAQESADAAKIIRPLMVRIQQALDLLPANGGESLQQLRRAVAQFFEKSGAVRVVKQALPDISSQFRFRKFEQNGYQYHVGSGRLGVPGKVKEHRSGYAQTKVSKGTGDDAGHLIGNRFGAPGGTENLGLQNWRANQYGTFKQLENRWAQKLKDGTGVEVVVRDITKAGETRPFARAVEWTEVLPNGQTTQHKLTFMNAHTDKSRTMQNIPPTVLAPQTDNVIHVDFVNRQRLVDGR